MSVCDEKFFVRINIYHPDERDSSIKYFHLVQKKNPSFYGMIKVQIVGALQPNYL